MDMKFFIHFFDVGVHRKKTDPQFVRRHFITIALGQQGKDFLFLRRKVVGLIRWGGLAKMADHFHGYGRGHGSTAPVDLIDAVDDFGHRCVFKDIAVCTGLEAGEDPDLILENRLHDHTDIREILLDGGHACNAIYFWHFDIH